MQWERQMNVKTITRQELAETVFRKVGLSRTESAELVALVLDEISSALDRDETVKLSSFGTFYVRDKNERIGRNPKTGEEAPISRRRVVTFKASILLKDRIFLAHKARAQKAGPQSLDK
jgi:integration host factor subunit alpha